MSASSSGLSVAVDLRGGRFFIATVLPRGSTATSTLSGRMVVPSFGQKRALSGSCALQVGQIATRASLADPLRKHVKMRAMRRLWGAVLVLAPVVAFAQAQA